ncbi:hypothetical protein TCAL_12653, partial [Tigriopus californicus]
YAILERAWNKGLILKPPLVKDRRVCNLGAGLEQRTHIEDSSGQRQTRENGSFGGISLDVIHNFQQTMNFTYELVESPDGTYGTRQNQSWTGFVGQLINGSADVCIATLTITHSRRKVIDFSIPIMWTDLSVFIANPYDKVNFLTYFAPLTLANWIALLILLVLATLVLDWTDQQSLATEEKMEFGRFKAL